MSPLSFGFTRFQVAHFLFLTLALSSTVWAQENLEKVAVNLHNNWYVQSSASVTDTGATISRPGYAHSGWLPTNIPATPLGAQFDNGLVPSPYVNENAAQITGTCYNVTTNYANVAWCSGRSEFPYQDGSAASWPSLEGSNG